MLAIIGGAGNFEPDADGGDGAFAARVGLDHVKGIAGFGSADFGGIYGIVAELFFGELMLRVTDLAISGDALGIEFDLDFDVGGSDV